MSKPRNKFSRVTFEVIYPTARLTHVLSDGLAQLRQASRRSVVREALVQGVGSCLDDVVRGIEIGLPDLEMDDVAAGAETRHALGEAEFCGLTHDGETSESESFLIVPS